jgi:hypothetical protein
LIDQGIAMFQGCPPDFVVLAGAELHVARVLCYCGVNWVEQTCPELVDTSTRTG